MPHKRKRNRRDEADFELPPDAIARPLAASKSRDTDSQTFKGRPKRRKTQEDDTPKEFARLMSRMRRPKRAVEAQTLDKDNRSKDRQNGAHEDRTGEYNDVDPLARQNTLKEIPKILPGERMADFSARVDQALPLNGLTTKGRVDLPGVKRQRTKLERKITRMQDEWRDQERRYRERLTEAEEEEEVEAIMDGKESGRRFKILDEEQISSRGRKKGKKGKRKGANKALGEIDDDPWAALAKSRRETEQQSSGLVGMHDVVQAPPRFQVQPKERFKVHDGAKVEIGSIPNASGSLRRREELEATRNQVLRDYRAKSKKYRSSE